jgi:hypothetical protein
VRKFGRAVKGRVIYAKIRHLLVISAGIAFKASSLSAIQQHKFLF